MKTNREKGNQLEELVVSYIKKIESTVRRTKNSGGSTELEDVLSSYFIVQCKVDNTHENIIVKKDDFIKLERALPISSTRIPIFINKQKDGIVTVTLRIEDYFSTVYKALSEKGNL